MKTTINLLDPSQRRALDGILTNEEDVAVIYGPPGTGKSHLILSLLFELAIRGDKVLFVSQNTEALNVIVRKYKELDKDLGVNDYSLSFLDFCWCLNDPENKKLGYIRQQRNRIMTRPINTLPFVREEDDNIPYALTYRRLDKNENIDAEPEKIGFDELLMSSLKNIHHSDLIADILRPVDDQSYREALRLLNDFSDNDKLFASLNNPKNALKYLTADKINYTLNDAKIIAQDICEAIDDTFGAHTMIANSEMNINDYLNYLYQINEYSKIIDIDHFSESECDIKDLTRTARKILTIEKGIGRTETGVISSLSDPILNKEEDSEILKLNNLSEIKEYSQYLTKMRENIGSLISSYEIDEGTKLRNILGCVFSEINFDIILKNNSSFNELGSDDINKVIEVVNDYNSRGALSRMFYSLPEDGIISNWETFNLYVDNLNFLKFLSVVLKDTNRVVRDIAKCKKIEMNAFSASIDIRKYSNEEYAELCNVVLCLLNMKLDNLNDYTLKELDIIAKRQISDINNILALVHKNKKIEFNSIAEATSAINSGISARNASRERKKIENELRPFLSKNSDMEESCKKIIELSKERIDLGKLLDCISSVKNISSITADYIDRIKKRIDIALQKGFFSSEFFTIHKGEDLAIWKKHIDTLIDYNHIDEFDAYISQNRFIKKLKETLTPRNIKIIDSYINDESITFDEFREHLTVDIIDAFYGNTSVSTRKRIDDKYFADFRANHRNKQIKEYLSGLQKLRLQYEDPAKVLSYIPNWVPASTNIEKIRRNSEMIMDAFPVTIATPADVSKYIKAKKGMYDYVIFDEASQLLPGQALPSIYRAKKAVIVGDPHQMPPALTVSLGFNGASDDEEDEDEDTSNEQSILDLAIKLQLDATYHLMTHYRSESNKLFEPSLKAIYEKEGVQPIIEAKSNEMPLYIEDNLGEDDNENFASVARRVEYYLGKDKDATFCILFSRSDAKGLYGFRKYLEKSGNQSIARLYENEKLLISTITNCQGIQGDHVILYLPSYRSPSQMWFFKKTAGAYRRLNVSITRAVQTLDIIMGDSRNKWIQVCQDFLNDVNCDSNQRKSAEILNNLLSNAGQEVDEEYLERSLGRNADNIDSPLTQQLYDRLNEYYADRLGKDLKIWCEVGWNMLIPDAESIEKNNRNVGFRIDIGIYSIKRKRFILGIEMDGATYHSGFRKEFSDLQRQAVLEKKGWNIYRIWSTNWLRDTEKEFQDLVKCIDGYLVGEYDDEDEMDNVDSTLGHDDEEELFIEEDSFEDMTKKMPDDYIGDVNGHDGIFYRPSDLFQANKYEVKLISTMKQHMEVGKPLEMKYSNTELSDNQKIATPYQMIYIKEIDEKDNFFLGSFSLTSSPYRIRLSDVFEYKIEPNVDESKRDDSENDAKSLDEKQAEVEIPEGESVVSEALLSFYLGHNVGEEISFRYQTNKQGSGEKWRNLKLIRYTEEYFWCRNLATDKVSMYRRDRVLEIKI